MNRLPHARSAIGPLTIAIALAVGCSSSNDDGGPGLGTDAPVGGGSLGGGAGQSSGGATAAAGGAASNHDGCDLESSDAPCNSCLHTKCLAACMGCSGNPDCLKLLDCLMACNGSSGCEQSCEDEFPGGVSDLVSVLGANDGCLATSCSEECGDGESGNGGGSGQTGNGGASSGGSGPAEGGSGGTSTGSELAGHVCSVTNAQGSGKEPNGQIPVCCGPSSAEKAEIEEVFKLLNEHRAANGVTPLTYSSTLEAAVQGHCLHMSLHTFFDHMAPESIVNSPWDRAQLCGDMAFGENIAMGQTSAAQVMAGWKASPGHNQNMLDASYTRVGIGYADGYWGQLFGQ